METPLVKEEEEQELEQQPRGLSAREKKRPARFVPEGMAEQSEQLVESRDARRRKRKTQVREEVRIKKQRLTGSTPYDIFPPTRGRGAANLVGKKPRMCLSTQAVPPPTKFKAGSIIQVRFRELSSGEWRWYRGTVLAPPKQHTVQVHFDDGERLWIDLNQNDWKEAGEERDGAQGKDKGGSNSKGKAPKAPTAPKAPSQHAQAPRRAADGGGPSGSVEMAGKAGKARKAPKAPKAPVEMATDATPEAMEQLKIWVNRCFVRAEKDGIVAGGVTNAMILSHLELFWDVEVPMLEPVKDTSVLAHGFFGSLEARNYSRVFWEGLQAAVFSCEEDDVGISRDAPLWEAARQAQALREPSMRM